MFLNRWPDWARYWFWCGLVITFALLANAGVAIALVLAWLGELGTGIPRLIRPSSRRRGLLRIGAILLPTVLLFGGQALLNPWLLRLVHTLWTMNQGE